MWLPEDVQAALEWADHEASKCGGCGLPRSETMAVDTPDQPAPRYHATALRCRACEARAVEARRFSEGQAGDAAGIYYAVAEDT